MNDGKMKVLSKKEFRELAGYAIHYRFCYCYLCGKPILPNEEWNLDHVRPRSKGGKSDSSNLRPTHYECNQAKGNMSIAKFRQIQQCLKDKEK